MLYNALKLPFRDVVLFGATNKSGNWNLPPQFEQDLRDTKIQTFSTQVQDKQARHCSLPGNCRKQNSERASLSVNLRLPDKRECERQTQERTTNSRIGMEALVQNAGRDDCI